MTDPTHEHDFVHLHLHTEYSLLDGFARIDEVVQYAKDLGMPALGITDHGTMFGVIDFYKACKSAGIKPIIGVEAYLASRKLTDRDPQLDSKSYHMLLLAENQDGYKNLLRLSSVAQLEGYYYRPRIDRDLMAAHAQGVIATSGCLAAEIPRMVMDGKEDEAKRLLGWYQDVFGKDNFYLELQAHDIEELRRLNTWLIANADYADIPLLATNDVHYVRSEDFEPHDTLLCIQTSAKVTDPKRMQMTDNSYYLRTQQQMWELFGHVPSALSNSLLIAERCQDLELTKQNYHLPVFPVPKGFDDPGDYLRYLCEGGLRWRFGDDPDSSAWDRLHHELNVITKMGFATYFLIVWDLTQFARRTDIWWNVRGSGAGSLVAYVLGITNLDPLENALLFERFLNPGRVSMPDMDLDFPEDRRMEMIDYCSRKYGSDKVAAIITFGTLGAKAAIRDVARALDVPLSHVDQIVRTIPTSPSLPSLPDLLGDDPDKAIPDLKDIYKRDDIAKKVIDLAAKVEGVPRHASTHAAGIIVADKPLVEYIPLHRPTKGDAENSPVKQVTQFPMETAEAIGLLKIDFLGLSTLTILRKACELIELYHGDHLDMSNIPYKPDPSNPQITRMVEETFQMMGEGHTIGVFQVESAGMRQMLTEMKPQTFEHIIAAISLYRPGPMDYIPMFNRRMHGEEAVHYHHEKLIPILQNTYGICISGESLVTDVLTGQQWRVDQLHEHPGPLYLQGVNQHNEPAIGEVTHLIETGQQLVYRLRLKNGASIKATAEHQFLTEQGWQRLGDLHPGDYIGTPPYLLEPQQPLSIERRKLLVLAYLIADGSLSNGSAIQFVNKEASLLDEYVQALTVFEDVEATFLTQIRDVTRVSIRHKNGKGTTSLLCWLRDLGLKYPAAMRLKGGCRSHEKFIPPFIFQLSNDDLAYFMACLWDCDGFIGPKFAHYKTISFKLAQAVQTLLLRLGISSVIHMNEYQNRVREDHTSYQVTVYDTTKLKELLSPFLISEKRLVHAKSIRHNTINRQYFIKEVESVTSLSKRAMMQAFGIDRQHFSQKRRTKERIASHIVKIMTQELPLPNTLAATQIIWEEIASIERAGVEAVYDLTVADTHNFVANGILVHNCVYQEQIMQIGAELFGYSLGEADLMRRAVSKKKEKDLMEHRQLFLERGPERGIDPEAANKIFDDIAFFARYGFNKSHAADYAVITCQTAFLKRHYPHEYMAALMSVYYDDADKVSVFIADCRRMGIAVLPPTLNASYADFHIEQGRNGTRSIRFGFGAIKNVGLGSVEYLLQEREAGGPFQDLDDFIKRCSLKDVGKRALESLIKVGAFDEFGIDRALLLVNLEAIMTFSSDYHKNAATGQSSIFDMLDGGGNSASNVGSVRSILKTQPDPEMDKREQLRWEKELVGLYLSEHPLQKLVAEMQYTNLYNTAELKADMDSLKGKSIRMVGLVAGIRTLTTKKGDAMAIVQLEDMQGMIEAVLFPRTWAMYRPFLEVDKVYLMEGKVDVRGNDVQLLADKVDQNLQVIAPNDPMPTFGAPAPAAFDDIEAPQSAPVSPRLAESRPAMESQSNQPPRRAESAKSMEEPPELAEAFAQHQYRDEDAPDDLGYESDDGMAVRPSKPAPSSPPPATAPRMESNPPPMRILGSLESYFHTPEAAPTSAAAEKPLYCINIEFEPSFDKDLDQRMLKVLVEKAIESPGRHFLQITYIDEYGERRYISFPDTIRVKVTHKRLEALRQHKRVKRVWVTTMGEPALG